MADKAWDAIRNAPTVEAGLLKLATKLGIQNPLDFLKILVSTLQKSLDIYLKALIQKGPRISIPDAVTQALSSR